MTLKARTKREGFGSYTVTACGLMVTISSFSRREGAAFDGWIARAEWDSFLYTDPLPTKRAAVVNAIAMIGEAKKDA
jgi:hypothetical protein